ncbi:MAG: MOSC domain-containing protein [Steroidobacteraceae bacterium]
MSVIALCLAPTKAAEMVKLAEMVVEAGAGVRGDHHFGTAQHVAGQNVTLIEAEEVEAFNVRTGLGLELTQPRRNIVTRGVRLNELVGREFAIGSAVFRGVELCEPCGKLARYLAGGGIDKARFVKEFTHRCGLRADVIRSGVVRMGDGVAAALPSS